MNIPRLKIASLFLLLTFTAASAAEATDTTRSFNIGYFEAGPYPVHSILRAEFYDQLENIVPDGYRFVIIAEGFRSAEWKRDQCRAMAKELTQVGSIDILVAMGPWVVHDLLEAGFDKPIVAMHQFDPAAEGLIGPDGKPVAANLTVHQNPNRLAEDLTILTRLTDVKRLGFLYFPSADENDVVLGKVKRIGEHLGFEVVTNQEFDNYGTFAFFKSFNLMDQDIDAIYLPPLWGLKTSNLGSFLDKLRGAGIPAFTSEGKPVLDRGAFATGSYYSIVSEARYNASKAVDIMRGVKPSELQVNFRGGLSLAVNNETARMCGITLPSEVLSDFYVVEAPVSGSVSYFSLADAVNRALTQNPGYLSRYETLQAAAEAARQAYSDYLPQIYGTLQATHYDDNYVSNRRNLVSNDQYRASLNLQQEIFSLETIRDIQSAGKKRELEEVNLGQAQLDLELAVSLAYLNYLRANELLQAVVTNRSLIEHNLELAQAKMEVDEGDSVDVVRLEDQRYRATMKVIDARAEVDIARVILNALFNLPGDEPLLLDSISFTEETFLRREGPIYDLTDDEPGRKLFTDRLVGEALVSNPSARAIDLRVDLQKTYLATNRARYFPTVGLEASLNFTNWLENTPTFEEETTTWSVGGFLRLPIFLGGDRIRERAKLKAKLSAIEYQRDDVDLNLMTGVRTNVRRFTAASTRMTTAFQSRKRAQAVLGLMVPGFSSGDTRLIDLLDAQSGVLEADLAAIRARYEYYESMARLVHAVGWTVHENYSDFVEQFHQQVTD